jgi:hypothetical protein
MGFKLIQAWPTDVSDITLSFDLNDTISTFSCTWNYQHFIMISDFSPEEPVIDQTA